MAERATGAGNNGDGGAAAPAAMRTIKIKAVLPVDFVDKKTLEFMDNRQ